MKNYILSLYNTILIDLNNIYSHLPISILNTIHNFKIDFITLSLNFNLSTNYIYIFFYLIFIIISTNYIYKFTYLTICYINFDLIYNIYIHLKHLKSFIILNKFEKKFLYYYKSLFKINLKQFLIGTGIVFFYLISYQLVIIFIEYILSTEYLYSKSNIYHNFGLKYLNILDFSFQFEYMNILITLIIIYMFLHIIFGLFNIFYDYLKDISFILFFLSFFIFFCLFNIFFIYINLEFYSFFIESFFY